MLWRVHAGRSTSGEVCVAVDVHYLPCGGARAAAVVAADATFGHLLAGRTGQVAKVPPYRSGQFYLRELPPLHAVLDGLDGMTLLIVDGYADLDPAGRAGLGAYAHAEFGVPVIGVAKTAFRAATHASRSYAGNALPGRCMSRPPGCPTTRPRTWFAIWQAVTGCPMPSAAPTPLPGAVRSDHDALAADSLIAA